MLVSVPLVPGVIWAVDDGATGENVSDVEKEATPNRSAIKNDKATFEAWPMPRGDAASSGATSESMPKDPVVLWEFQAEEAIESIPVVSKDAVFAADVM
ncbi:MAG: hypothetical protein AAGJ83_16025, partial [Planctomycetota bacterium]